MGLKSKWLTFGSFIYFRFLKNNLVSSTESYLMYKLLPVINQLLFWDITCFQSYLFLLTWNGVFGVQRVKVNCQDGWEMVDPHLGRTRGGGSEKETTGVGSDGWGSDGDEGAEWPKSGGTAEYKAVLTCIKDADGTDYTSETSCNNSRETFQKGTTSRGRQQQDFGSYRVAGCLAMDRAEQTGGCHANTGITLLGVPGLGHPWKWRWMWAMKQGHRWKFRLRSSCLALHPCPPSPARDPVPGRSGYKFLDWGSSAQQGRGQCTGSREGQGWPHSPAPLSHREHQKNQHQDLRDKRILIVPKKREWSIMKKGTFRKQMSSWKLKITG